MEGGAYKPLSGRDIERIHTTALDVLEKIGIGEPIPEILHYALPKGCTLGDDGRLRFPRALVEDMIAISAGEYVLYSPSDPSRDLEVKGQQVLMSTSGEAVNILDYRTQKYRPTKLTDLYDAARLGDRMEHIHAFGQPFIAAEWSHDLYVHDMNIAYAELAGTCKSFSLGIAVVDHIDPLIRLFDLHLGREGAFLERPFCIFGGCPIVSPLRFGKENAEVMVKVAQLGLVGDIAVAGQAGATAPAPLAGALAQSFAETLACLVVVNLIRPGCAMNFGMWPFISDLRTGAFSGGSGEEALVTAATAQLCNHYARRGPGRRKLRQRVPGHRRQSPCAVVRGHGHRQRHDGNGAAAAARYRGQRRNPGLRGDRESRLRRGTLPQPDADPRADAVRVPLPGGRRSAYRR
jgi:trimethylamine--corrinoid protein Co-methyltransferase